jgi:two-component sensor histidine kinase
VLLGFGRFAVRHWVRYLPHHPISFWRGQAAAVACVAVAAILRFILDPYLAGMPFLTFFPAVFVASMFGGGLAGISTLLLSSLMAALAWFGQNANVHLFVNIWIAVAAFWVFGGLVIVVSILLRALVTAMEHANVVAREMQHRVGNLLSVVVGVSHQTARTATTVEEYKTIFEERLVALARSQQLAVANREMPRNLQTLLQQVLEPFGLDRFVIIGPKACVISDIGSSVALLVNELGTNAVKYGALSVPEGHASLRWTADHGRVTLRWREMDGPPVTAPKRYGFGSSLLQNAFSTEQGSVTIAFKPDGVECVLVFAAMADAAAC